MFSFEIYGREGSIVVNGLAGHYGPQKLQTTRRREQGGPPELQELDFGSGNKGSAQDDVWTREWAAFISSAVDHKEAREGKQCSSASGLDAWEALKIVEAAYEASRSGKGVMLGPFAAVSSDVSSCRQ